MQYIRRTNSHIHPLFDEMELFYAALSENPENKAENRIVPLVFDTSLKPIQEVFNQYTDMEFDFQYKNKHYAKLTLPKFDAKNIIVCFSGGKDSAATALYYKKKGYNVFLYHVKGINKSYPTEWVYAEQLAEHLKMPLITENVSLRGNHCYVDHPMKNMIIANMALSYGIRNHITTKIAMGNYTTSHLEDDPFEVCGDDDIEMWEIYNRIIQKIIPRFKIYLALTNIEDSMNTLAENPNLLPYISSCVGAYRFMEVNKRHNKEKYGIELVGNRCGSCWKCAYEYIYLTDHGVFDYNEEYYKHCLDVLRQTIKRERGRKVTREEAFNTYFFYSLEKSALLTF